MSINTITYAGHSAFLFDTSAGMIAIDPWLSGNPLCPATLKDPKSLDLIILSHGHSDHAGDAAQLAKRTGAKIAATYELAELMIADGVPSGQIVHMNKGGSATIGTATVTLTHAFHSSSYDTKNGPVYAGEPCGIVLKVGTTTIYHAGDTALFSDMRLIGERHKPEIAFLPIGDCFTMGPADAADAAKLIGSALIIPMHFATFPNLTGTPQAFQEACAKIGAGDVLTMKPGQSHAL